MNYSEWRYKSNQHLSRIVTKGNRPNNQVLCCVFITRAQFSRPFLFCSTRLKPNHIRLMIFRQSGCLCSAAMPGFVPSEGWLVRMTSSDALKAAGKLQELAQPTGSTPAHRRKVNLWSSPIRTLVLRVFLLAAVAQLCRGLERQVLLSFQPVGLHVAFALGDVGRIKCSEHRLERAFSSKNSFINIETIWLPGHKYLKNVSKSHASPLQRFCPSPQWCRARVPGGLWWSDWCVSACPAQTDAHTHKTTARAQYWKTSSISAYLNRQREVQFWRSFIQGSSSFMRVLGGD